MTFLCSFGSAYAQRAVAGNKTYLSSDIWKANDSKHCLNAGRVRKIRLRASPKGGGKVNEVTSSARSLHYFEKENNIVWLKFTAIKTSGLVFTILPDSINDDYDFLLFKDVGETTLSKIRNKQLKPIRTNISRTQKVDEGRTGLSLDATSEFERSGLNSRFSSAMNVTEGESFYLVLNNVYDNGGGALIEFCYYDAKEINGVVKNEMGKPVEAEITWESTRSGIRLASTKSNKEDGKFKLVVPYEKQGLDTYTISAYSDDCLFSEVTYTPIEIETRPEKPLAMVIPTLKRGAKMRMGNVNFVGNKPVFLKEAYPSLKRLKKLMRKNKEMAILIVGHTNGCSGSVLDMQRLSENRAIATQDYLIDNGIATQRMEIEGRNCEEMLYPITSSPELQKLNRRIEVFVTNYQ